MLLKRELQREGQQQNAHWVATTYRSTPELEQIHAVEKSAHIHESHAALEA